MIFKNENRCLERLHEGPSALRDAIPCDTGDGGFTVRRRSREIAGTYAIFSLTSPGSTDFCRRPQRSNDAAPASCSSPSTGRVVDEGYFRLSTFWQQNCGASFETGASLCGIITIRPHLDYWGSGGYRLSEVDTRLPLPGRIHEALPLKDAERCFRSRTILHHDGYVVEWGPRGKGKRGSKYAPAGENCWSKKPETLRLLGSAWKSARTLENVERYLRQGNRGWKKQTGWDVRARTLPLRSSVRKEKEGEDGHSMKGWLPA